MAFHIPSSMRRWRFWAAAYFAWFVVLCILSSMSHPFGQPQIWGFDKVEHFSYFAAGATALWLAGKLRRPALTSPKWFLIVVSIGALVGWFDEWHQSMTPGRFGLDAYDWAADLLGSLAGALAAPLFHRRICS